jgi:hypothetical protein
MTTYYLNSVGGSATAPYDTWAKGSTTYATLLAIPLVAGDIIYVASDHSETPGSTQTITFPGTLASPNQLISADRTSGSPPTTLANGAIIGTTGNFGINFTGCGYVKGVTWKLGSGAVSPAIQMGGTTQTDITFRDCAVQLIATSGASVTVGSSSNSIGARVTWDNTTYQTGGTSQLIYVNQSGYFHWKNTASATSGTAPTTLFGSTSQTGGTTLLEGVDISALSGKTFVQALAKGGTYTLQDSITPASFTYFTAPTSAAPEIYIVTSANGATTTTLEKHTARGDQTTELTVVRTGGCTVDGVSIAMKLVSSANAFWHVPFGSTPLAIRNTTTGTNRTVTVYGVWGGGAVPNNDDIWTEVKYRGSASSPQASFATTTKASIIAANAATTTDSSTWGGSTTKFKMVATLSSPQPALSGPISVRVYVGATSSTFYIDPVAELG